MKKIEFKKLIKNENPKKIIRMHCNWLINLTTKQLNEVLELKNKMENKKTC